MIRSLPLICSDCGKEFTPQKQLSYRHDPMMNDLRNLSLVCPSCIEAWQEKWRIAEALFKERDYVLTVTITLADGTVYKNLDCTPLKDEQLVITEKDMPETAQKRLYKYYLKWKEERCSLQLEDCFFTHRNDGVYFASLRTRGGERYDDLGVMFTEDGTLLVERELPEYILEQLSVSLKTYQSQEIMLSAAANPLPRPARIRDSGSKRRINAGFTDSFSENSFGNSFSTREKPWKN